MACPCRPQVRQGCSWSVVREAPGPLGGGLPGPTTSRCGSPRRHHVWPAADGRGASPRWCVLQAQAGCVGGHLASPAHGMRRRARPRDSHPGADGASSAQPRCSGTCGASAYCRLVPAPAGRSSVITYVLGHCR
jgi:hypothetical protein